MSDTILVASDLTISSGVHCLTQWGGFFDFESSNIILEKRLWTVSSGMQGRHDSCNSHTRSLRDGGHFRHVAVAAPDKYTVYTNLLLIFYRCNNRL
jgi:hypothetical protein